MMAHKARVHSANNVSRPAQKSETKTIQIVGLSTFPELLRDLVKSLNAEGYRCLMSDSYEAFDPGGRHPDNKLFLVGAALDDLSRLLGVIRAVPDHVPSVPVLVCLSDSPSSLPVELLAPEIDDFLLPPLSVDDLLLRMRRLLLRSAAGPDNLEQLKRDLVSHASMRQFVGQAPAFLAVKEALPRIAACDATVLLTGETGTGKELCARAIHYLSSRRAGPFIPVNCSAIPTELFENELFGHERGAFTGAFQTHRGLIAEADGGTLFLDEIDSLPTLAQVKLLRFLQDRQYKPLGAVRYRQVNTRLVAASNQDLRGQVQKQAFRSDLYFRLKIVSLSLPPLRTRREDIPILAEHFLKKAIEAYRVRPTRFSQEALLKLCSYDWPGNVRELENLICQSAILTEADVIRVQDLGLGTEEEEARLSNREPFQLAKARVVEAFESDYLRQVLVANEGNISRAAREAQKDRRTFFALLKKHGLTLGRKQLRP